jgi:hypothetical protein
MRPSRRTVAATVVATLAFGAAAAGTTVFFTPCQTYTVVQVGQTFDTIRSNGYLFTYTRDKLFGGGTGRYIRVPWPTGIEAQAVTVLPPGQTDTKAHVTIQRADSQVFDFPAFTFQLLANTGGAGAQLEIMPQLGGEDAFPDPVFFDATGYYGQRFSYDTSPNPWGTTALLKGFDTYKVTLYVDFAFVALTFGATAADVESCCLPSAVCSDLTAASCAAQGGTSLGAGTSCSCNPCQAAAGASPVPDGSNGTTPLRAARLTSAGDTMQITWDATACTAVDYDLIYGPLGSVGTYTLTGAACSMGTSGFYLWSGVPTGNLYFLAVGVDGAGAESSWGLDSAGQERNGSLPSGYCGAAVKDLSRTCP